MKTLKWIGGAFALFLLAASLTPDDPTANSQRWAAGAEASALQKVKQRLRDPESAVFQNVTVNLSTNPSYGTVCGEVNSRNGFGGFGGFQKFVVIIQRGEPNRLMVSPALMQEDFRGLFGTEVDSQCRPGFIPIADTSPSSAAAAPTRAVPPPTTLPSATRIGTALVKQDSNVRGGPSQSAAVVRRAPAGASLTVFGESGSWVQIGDGEPWGYVHSSLLERRP